MHAVFLQVTLVNSTAQVIVTPAQGLAAQKTYFRYTTPGARGRAARWDDITGRESAVVNFLRDNRLDFTPVLIEFTDSDAAQVIDRNSPTTLGTKAVREAAKHAGPTGLTLGRVLLDSGILDGLHPGFVIEVDVPAPSPVVRPVSVTPTTPAVDTVSEPEPALRMASVPDISIAKAYVHRTVYGQDDFAIFAKARARKENILLKGPTGAAKTMSALAFAASEGLPTFTISGSVNFEASEAIGQMMLDPVTGLPYFQYGGAIEVIRSGGVLILDEINFIPSKVITPFFPLLDDRREVVLKQNKGEIIKAHPDLLIVATMNPGYLGTQAMNFALANRFDHHLEWGYDEKVEKVLVSSKSLREFANQLRANPTIATPVPTNALMSIASNSTEFSLDYALANFLARFDDAERKAVDLILQSIRSNVESDLGLNVDAEPLEQDEVAPDTDWIDALDRLTIHPPTAPTAAVPAPNGGFDASTYPSILNTIVDASRNQSGENA